VYVKYEHLVEQGIIANRPQLARWTERSHCFRPKLAALESIASRERRAPKVWPNKKRMAAKAAREAATAAE
jgi:hypothetical protein